jgi:hypothetical protein
MSLIGTWEADETDSRALADFGDVLLDFQDNGELLYAIRGAEKAQLMLLHYHVEGTTIITDQPSAPRVEHTAFSLSDDGVLTLAFGGTPYRFKRRL